jgi:hypothetical protein
MSEIKDLWIKTDALLLQSDRREAEEAKLFLRQGLNEWMHRILYGRAHLVDYKQKVVRMHVRTMMDLLSELRAENEILFDELQVREQDLKAAEKQLQKKDKDPVPV